MAKRVNALEESLQRFDQIRHRIVDAAFLHVCQPLRREVLLERVVSFFDDQDALFNQVRISKPVFPCEKK